MLYLSSEGPDPPWLSAILAMPKRGICRVALPFRWLKSQHDLFIARKVRDKEIKAAASMRHQDPPRPRRPLTICEVHAKNFPLEKRIGIFAKLPVEIRQMVFTYVLGGHIIDPIYEWLAARWIYHDCGTRGFVGPNLCACLGEDRKHRLALLQTCRQIYIEAIGLLYSTNSFGIYTYNVMDPIVCFFRAIQPQRLAFITTIDVKLYVQSMGPDAAPMPKDRIGYSDAYVGWRRLWHLMATEMTSLRNLDMAVSESELRRPEDLDPKADWVKPLLAVRGLRRVDLRFDACPDMDLGGFSEERYCEKLEELQGYLREVMCA